MNVDYLNNHTHECECNQCVNNAFKQAGKTYYQFLQPISIHDIGEFMREFNRMWASTEAKPYYRKDLM